MTSQRSMFIGSGGNFGRAQILARGGYVAAEFDDAHALVIRLQSGNWDGRPVRMTRERFTISFTESGRLVTNDETNIDRQIRITRRPARLNDEVLIEALSQHVVVSGERVAEGQAIVARLPADVSVGPSRIRIAAARADALPAWLTVGVPVAVVLGGLVGWIVPTILTDFINLILGW